MQLKTIPVGGTPQEYSKSDEGTTPRKTAALTLAEQLEVMMKGAGISEDRCRQIVADEIRSLPQGTDENRVRVIASDVVRKYVNRVTVNVQGKQEEVTIDGAHAYLQVALAVVGAQVPLLLFGAKGVGKTTLAEQLAKALSLDFASINCSGAMTAGKLVGFSNPMTGGWFRGELSRHLDKETLVLVDEADVGDPGVQLCMNSILANRYIGEPEGLLRCHDRFAMVLATNTINGATREYNGREKLDGALLDRVAVLELHLDNSVEAALCGVTEKSTLNGDPRRGGLTKPSSWLTEVRTARTVLLSKGMTAFAPSPRAAKDGARLSGVLGLHWLRELFLYRGCQPDVRNIIESELNKGY